MDSAGYVALSRQSGLMREMGLIANNIANISTTGFRREGVIFAEYVKSVAQEGSLSMTRGNARHIDLAQAGMTQTGTSFDLAIQGKGFFLLQTPMGERLTRSGAFTPNAEGLLANPDGNLLLDQGGAPIFVPPGQKVSIGEDGTLSSGGVAIAQIGLWSSVDPLQLRHSAGTLFEAGAVEEEEDGKILQGFLEDSNVNPIGEIARMIAVQRAYEMGQKFIEAEDGRMRNTVQTLGERG